jgi:hypoxanthine phosphoribosyltransferase
MAMKPAIVTDRGFHEVVPVPEAGIMEARASGKRADLPASCRERVDRVIIPESCLKKRVKALSRQICQDYVSMGINGINIVYILEGAFMFASDLEREIFRNRGLEIFSSSSLKASTYGREIKKTGEVERKVKIIHMPEVRGKDILLVEDIVDQGFTLARIIRMLKDKKVKTLKVCVLLNKILNNPAPRVRRVRESLAFDYVGFEIPDRWIAGYGIDAGGDFRDLPFIITVNEKFYLRKK